MDEYLLDDDSVEEINWHQMTRAKHLDPTKSYIKMLYEINECLEPNKNLSLELDYESMKLLLKQARESDIPFINSPDLEALMILYNTNSDVREQLFIEEGFLGKKTARITDPHIYRNTVNTLAANNDVTDIRTARRSYLEELLTDKIFYMKLSLAPEREIHSWHYYFNNRAEALTEAQGINMFVLDLFSDYIFDDYFNNAAIDISQMMKYIGLTNNTNVPTNRLELYKSILLLGSMSTDERIDFFNDIKGIQIEEGFYDDVRFLKDESYRSLVDSCTKFTRESKFYNEELSQKYGCDIYYLDGDPFYGFVRSDAKTIKYNLGHDEEGKPMLIEGPQPTEKEVNRLGNSFTYIGKGDIQTFKDPRLHLTMFYEGVNPDNIGHIYHNDSWSNATYMFYSDFQNEIHTPDSLLDESTKYPEILITDLEGIKPSALICMDEVTPWDVKFSKHNNLPIVVINSKKYETKYAKEDLYADHYTR